MDAPLRSPVCSEGDGRGRPGLRADDLVAGSRDSLTAARVIGAGRAAGSCFTS